MTEYVRVPRDGPDIIWLEPSCCADPSHGRQWCEDDAFPVCEDGHEPVKYIRADLAASPQGEGSSGDPAPIKPSGDTGELRKRVAKIVDPAGFDDRWDVPGLRHEASLDERVDEALAKADAILDLIQKATTPKAGERG